ncbi:MAG: hypothetical protein FJ098_13855, partial [Deltaproteobacteria bacterium]|nr:hypothetical protein [Deltaproteobacteria bacterium]
MTPKNPVHRLGIDAGALFFKAVLLDPAGGPVLRMRMAHQGDAERWADALLEQVTALGLPVVAGLTGSLAERVAPRLGLEVLEPVTALVETVRREHPGARHVIDAGGGSLSLMTLGADGAFEGYERNSLCAAGTGSFLDEQGARLGITWEELRDLVPVERPPSVAARCAVFAK